MWKNINSWFEEESKKQSKLWQMNKYEQQYKKKKDKYISY